MLQGRMRRRRVLGQRPGKKNSATGSQQVLAAVQFVGNRRTFHGIAQAGMPEGFPIAGVESQDVAHGVAGKRQSRIGGENSGARAAGPDFVGPADFARLVVNGFDDSFAPQPIVSAGPAIGSIGWL